jgi:hypothetical protein
LATIWSPRSRSTAAAARCERAESSSRIIGGLIINPDTGSGGASKGNVVQRANRALAEKVAFDRAKVTSTDWFTVSLTQRQIFRQVELPLGHFWGPAQGDGLHKGYRRR